MTTRKRSMARSVGKMMVKYHTEDKQNLETRSACYGCASSLQKTAQNKAEPFVLKNMSFSFDVYGEKLKEKCCMRASGCCRVTNTLYMQLFIVLVSVSYANWSGISRTHKKTSWDIFFIGFASHLTALRTPKPNRGVQTQGHLCKSRLH